MLSSIWFGNVATTHGPDLEAGRLAIENLMDDTCEVWRDPTSSEDAVLDPETGALVTTGLIRIYPTDAMVALTPTMDTDGGPCQVKSVGLGFSVTRTTVQGGDPETYHLFNFKFPINDAPLFMEGDSIIVKSSRRDPTLPTTPFVVREATMSSFAVSRKVLTERRTKSAR